MCNNSQLFLTRTVGRLVLNLVAFSLGPDIQVLLYGGDAHVGAVALAVPEGLLTVSGAQGHREQAIAAEIAIFLANQLRCNVAVSAGIHYDAINKAEIATALELAMQLARDLAARLKSGGAMLTIQELNGFESYIKSGRMETEFKCASEDEPIKMLELLEKLMDVADLADEAATRLIFRGQIPVQAH